MLKILKYRSLIISIDHYCDPHSKESEFFWQVLKQDKSIIEESDFGFESEQESIDSAKEYIDSWYE